MNPDRTGKTGLLQAGLLCWSKSLAEKKLAWICIYSLTANGMLAFIYYANSSRFCCDDTVTVSAHCKFGKKFGPVQILVAFSKCTQKRWYWSILFFHSFKDIAILANLLRTLPSHQRTLL